MPYKYCISKKLTLCAGLIIGLFLFGFLGTSPVQAYYNPPSNTPGGSPPNYNQVDSMYFFGEPVIPNPPPDDSGGFYVWVDTSPSGRFAYNRGFAWYLHKARYCRRKRLYLKPAENPFWLKCWREIAQASCPLKIYDWQHSNSNWYQPKHKIPRNHPAAD